MFPPGVLIAVRGPSPACVDFISNVLETGHDSASTATSATSSAATPSTSRAPHPRSSATCRCQPAATPLPCRCHAAAAPLSGWSHVAAKLLPCRCQDDAATVRPLPGTGLATAAPRTSYLRRAPFRPPCPMLRISDDNTRKENKGVNKNYKYLGSYR